jgi:hypothetical protein
MVYLRAYHVFSSVSSSFFFSLCLFSRCTAPQVPSHPIPFNFQRVHDVWLFEFRVLAVCAPQVHQIDITQNMQLAH